MRADDLMVVHNSQKAIEGLLEMKDAEITRLNRERVHLLTQLAEMTDQIMDLAKANRHLSQQVISGEGVQFGKTH